MAAGPDTFIASMLAGIGGVSVVEGRYPEIPVERIRAADRVYLSSEPFPFQDRHAAELSEQGVDRSRIAFVDGELMSWHGTRMALGLEYLAELSAARPS